MVKTTNVKDTHKAVSKRGKRASEGASELGFSALSFRRRLGAWYQENARTLPWRGVRDPYATWLSEIGRAHV